MKKMKKIKKRKSMKKGMMRKKMKKTSLGTSVSNSDFDLGYTGLKAEDFCWAGGTPVLT
jgi:hypothetical protein